ncbi:TadE/TadG family type IV pilus assembly protein [Croceibacterium ferulae]|uniref:TadE/TadG family type IV pilus assembly protein n=1 Tax=Croceibacterium ferulae TaxID=1854641 RepID=UPI000EB41F14|nr:TadE/TadG family type IV pilus assembly protein [Croceibacterium ferulae]
MNTRDFVRRLIRDRRGAALPIMAAGLLPVLAGVGAAIDIGRIVIVRSQMQAGVDAGALAGARVFGLKDDRAEQVTAYFHANMPDGYVGADPIEPVPDFQEVRGVNRVKVAATTELPMVFMRLFGIETSTITVDAVAEMQPKPLEVMVVLDDTGSMGGGLDKGTRMTALQTAMYDFINILHQGKTRREDLAMGIVTYTVTTNVGQILKDANVPIMARDGFTNVSKYTGGSNEAPSNPLAWRGCVENDPTQRDLSEFATVMEEKAWDIDSILPGEKGRPGVRPYHVPPVTTTKVSDAAFSASARVPANYEAAHPNTATWTDRKNNLYRLSADGRLDIAQTLANTDAYRQYFYDFYIGLNHGKNNSPDDDVIVRASDNGPYTPGSTDEWKVVYSRIPYIGATTDWSEPNKAYGYPTRSGRNLKMPTPNWQCPEPALKLAYGQAKSVYDNYIKYDNYPVMPADGTLHHIGMLWGYRLLTRSDVFIRHNPVPAETPLRALVFMTDGESNANRHAAWYGAYGNMRERRISSSDSDIGKFKKQVMYRFAKVCENAKRDGIAVYIVSLGTTSDDAENVFSACAGTNFLETTTQSQIQNAFRQIAVDLVDLHLTQ